MIKNLFCYHLDQFCGTAIKFLMFSHNYCYILLDYTSASQYPVPCIMYLCVSYFADAVSKWCTIFKCYLLISFVCIPFRCFCSCSSDCYGSLHKYVCITVFASSRLYHCGFEFYLAIHIVTSTYLIAYINPIFCSAFRWLISCVVE